MIPGQSGKLMQKHLTQGAGDVWNFAPLRLCAFA
jgi:hypothetical protein